MAQKPNFLKKLISTGLVTASTVTMIAGFSGSAMGASQNINKSLDLDATGIGGIANGDSLVYVVQGGGPFIGKATGGNDKNGAPTVLFGSIDMQQNGVFTVTAAADITIGSVSSSTNNAAALLTLNINSGQTLTLNGAAAFPLNTYTNLGPVNFGDNVAALKVSLAANGADGTKTATFGKDATFNGAAAGQGSITIDNGNIAVFNGTIGNTNGIQFLTLTGNAQATLNATAKFDAAVGVVGIGLDNGAILNVADGANIIGTAGGNNASINGVAAGNGMVNFLGASTVSTDIGVVQNLAEVNVAGALTFQGGNNGGDSTFAATAINLTTADSVINFTTQKHKVTGNILNTSKTNNQGGLSINGGDVKITGSVGADGASLATINFQTDNSLGINSKTGLFVQNVNTNTANTGTLALQGANFAINGNIGANNPLKIVALSDDGVGAAAKTNFTLKQGSSISAQNIYLSATQDNTLTLEEGTTVTGDIVNTNGGGAGKGAIVLTGNATINGSIGGAGGVASAIKSIDLGGKNLAFGGTVISTDANPGIIFRASETLAITNKTANANIEISAAISLTAGATNGTIDASTLTNTQTLTISPIGDAGTNTLLSQLKAGAGNVVLKGSSAINNVDLSGGGALTLSDNGGGVAAEFKIVQTTNAANQGTVNINPTNRTKNNGVYYNVVTLGAGSNLGSLANPLNTVKFGAVHQGRADDDVLLSFNKGANLYANTITNTTNKTGSFLFDDGGVTIVSGTVGGPDNNFNRVEVINNTTAQFLGNATFSGPSTIDNGSTLQIGGNYIANSIVGKAANNGTLQFVNADPITVTLNTENISVNALAAVQVSGSGNVTFAANQGIAFSTINFNDASLGTDLYLPSGVELDDLTITSEVGNNGNKIPFVYVSNADSTIGANPPFGSQGNIVGLGFATDNTITVDAGATTLYAAFDTTKNGQGTVVLSGNNTSGTVYGLGISNQLKLVTVTTNYNNLGNLNAANLVVNDDLTFITGGAFGKNFNGTITLGSVNGNSNVEFVNGINSTESSTVAALKANAGTVTYLGDATVGNIGSANIPVASIEFNGSRATLQGATYAQTTDFGDANLIIAGPNVIIGGANNINGNINLGTNSLTFASGTSTWGSDTSLTATLNVDSSGVGTLGNITIANGAEVDAEDVAVTINVQDNASANFTSTQSYDFIKGGARFSGDLKSSKISGSNRFVAYGLVQADNGDYQLTRTGDSKNVFTQSIAGSPIANTPYVLENLAAFTNPANGGNVAAAFDNSLLSKNSADDSKFLAALLTDTSAATANVNIGVTQEVQGINAGRAGESMAKLRELGTPESAKMASSEGGVVSSGDEDPQDNVAYGAWAKPFYTHSNQKERRGVAGYKSNTTGIIVGLDTLANDNLMIGAAIAFAKTDVKHQNYKKGDKTDIDNFSFSLYGAQQLVNNIFAQGTATFSINHVKNKSVRYVFDSNGNLSPQTASANYNNMTFGGNVMLGYDANVIEGLVISPAVGLSYLRTSDESYKEKGTTFLNKQVNSKFGDRTDLIAGAKVIGGTMNITDIALYPEAHAFIIQKIGGKLSKTQSQLDGQVQPFISQPDRTAKTTYNLGFSASIRPDAKMEYGIGYDANIANKFVSHQGTLKVRVNF